MTYDLAVLGSDDLGRARRRYLHRKLRTAHKARRIAAKNIRAILVTLPRSFHGVDYDMEAYCGSLGFSWKSIKNAFKKVGRVFKSVAKAALQIIPGGGAILAANDLASDAINLVKDTASLAKRKAKKVVSSVAEKVKEFAPEIDYGKQAPLIRKRMTAALQQQQRRTPSPMVQAARNVQQGRQAGYSAPQQAQPMNVKAGYTQPAPVAPMNLTTLLPAILPLAMMFFKR